MDGLFENKEDKFPVCGSQWLKTKFMSSLQSSHDGHTQSDIIVQGSLHSRLVVVILGSLAGRNG